MQALVVALLGSRRAHRRSRCASPGSLLRRSRPRRNASARLHASSPGRVGERLRFGERWMLRICVAARDQRERGDHVRAIRQRQPRRRWRRGTPTDRRGCAEILVGRLRHALVRLADHVEPPEHAVEAVELCGRAIGSAVHAVARATAQCVICVLNSSEQLRRYADGERLRPHLTRIDHRRIARRRVR